MNKSMTELENLIQKQIPKIPPQVREYLQSSNYPQVMRDVVSKHNLHINTASKIEIETTLLLIGLVAPNEYEQRLVSAANLPQGLARAISNDMNEQVFKPLVAKYKKPTPELTPNVFADEPAVQAPREEVAAPIQEAEVPEVPIQIPVETPPEPVVEKKIEKKYAIDPYREPIE